MLQFRLPDPGEGLVEAEIVTWRVAVGDEVKINDIVVEIETSKSLVELPIPFAGTVSALLASEGDMVEVGAPIITVDDGTDVQVPATPSNITTAADPVSSTGSVGASGTVREDLVPSLPAEADDDEQIEDGKIGGAAPGGRVAILVGYGPRTTETKRRPRKTGMPDPMKEQAHAQVAETFSTTVPVSRRADERTPLPGGQDAPVGVALPGPGAARTEPTIRGGAVLAKPPVRKLAKDLGIDLGAVTGTGPGGVITRPDVESFGAPPAPVPAPSVSAAPVLSSGEDRRIPIKGVRKMTAEAMVASAFTAPHVTEWLTCDVTASMELLERLKTRRDFSGVRVSPLLLVAKAVCLALGCSPELNSSWDEAAREIVIKGAVNLGIAAATPRGLLVPNVKNAQTLGLLELAESITGLVNVAKEGRTQPADTAQGTFTITNVGVFGIDAGTPILNPGEAGILCIGAIDRRPWVVGTGADERIEPRWVTTLALSFDHRLVDGEQGSKFLADVASILRDPGLALLF